MQERHVKQSTEFKSAVFGWFSRLELDLKYQTATSAAGAAFVNKIISKAETKPHPMFPKDKSMKLYRVLSDL